MLLLRLYWCGEPVLSSGAMETLARVAVEGLGLWSIAAGACVGVHGLYYQRDHKNHVLKSKGHAGHTSH